MDLIETHGVGALGAVAVMFFAGGFVKGLVGFALPLVAVTGAVSLLPAEAAVAAIIFPVIISNFVQAVRQGIGLLLETVRRFWAMNLTLAVMIVVGANILPGLDERLFFVVIGSVTLSAALIQLLGWRPKISARYEKPASIATGAAAGVIGGLSGIWGPPVVLLLGALRVGKKEHLRAAGLAFLVGSIVLAPAHYGTGVLNGSNALFSLFLCVPTMLGMVVGQAAEGKLDAERFRVATLVVLAVAALNLLRRAVFG